MDQKQGIGDELLDAIRHFEAAAARRRALPDPGPAPGPVRGPRRGPIRWVVPTAAAVTAVLLSRLTADWVVVPNPPDRPATTVSALMPPEPLRSVPIEPRAPAPASVTGDTSVVAPVVPEPVIPPPPPGEPVAGGNETDTAPRADVRPGPAESAVVAENRRLGRTPTLDAPPESDAVFTTQPSVVTTPLRLMPAPELPPPLPSPTRLAEAAPSPSTAVEVSSSVEARPAIATPASPLVPYRGVLTDATGAPLTGAVSAIFAIYDGPDGGLPLWVDIKTLEADASGAFEVVLGGTGGLPDGLLADDATRWLGVQAAGQDEQPRIQLVVPEPAGLGTPATRPGLAAAAEADTPRIWLAEDAPADPAAGSPLLVPHSGMMTDADGVALQGQRSAIFALYKRRSGGVPLWVDIRTVQVDATGAYSVVLGDSTELPLDLVSGATRWLGVQPDGEDEQQRVPFSIAQTPRLPRPVGVEAYPVAALVGFQGTTGPARPSRGQYESCQRTVPVLAGSLGHHDAP